MNARTTWLLDIDGVINANKPGWSECPHAAYAYSMGEQYKMRWSPSLMIRIRTVANDPDAEIVWSTTWVDDVEQLENRWCLPRLRCAFKKLKTKYTGDLKLAAAKKVLEDGGRLIWTDDTETPESHWPLYKELKSLGTCLLIRPKGNRGLQPEDMDAIEAFIKAD